jgi:hypothetical protein
MSVRSSSKRKTKKLQHGVLRRRGWGMAWQLRTPQQVQAARRGAMAVLDSVLAQGLLSASQLMLTGAFVRLTGRVATTHTLRASSRLQQR